MTKAETRLPLKVIPGASRDSVAGWLEDTLKIRVRAPAERGKANRSVEALVAAQLGIPKNAVRIVSGHTSPRKVVEILGLSPEEIGQRLPKRQPSRAERAGAAVSSEEGA